MSFFWVKVMDEVNMSLKPELKGNSIKVDKDVFIQNCEKQRVLCKLREAFILIKRLNKRKKRNHLCK
jgi:hypothetical protein